MTTYLTKKEDGKTHHFRITVENNGVSIVTGVFYNWLGKHFEGCGDNASAVERQKQLIDEKRKDGFHITEFIQTLENTTDVYDKAKWHYDGEFPSELDESQGFVHTGMFLGWLVDNDLMSEEFNSDFEDDIRDFKSQELTGAQIFERCCDGVLMLEDISEPGNRFALHYFDFDKGQYLVDYETLLAKGLPTMYHVEDTWENYKKLKIQLDKRHSEWKNQNNKKPFWKFW